MRPLLPLLLAASVAACDQAPTAPATPRAQFEDYWASFATMYPSFPLKGVDWEAQRRVFQPLAEQAPSTDSLVRILSQMARPLRDAHATFITPTGQRIPSWAPEALVNFLAPARDATLGVELTVLRRDVTFARVGEVGYLAIGVWDRDAAPVADVDAALERLRGVRALVLDVRMNPGGWEDVASQVAGRFVARPLTGSYLRRRTGGSPSALGPAEPQVVAPRGPWTWTTPVYVLAGRGSFSATESFISALRELPNVTVLGDTTGGSTGHPQERPLGGGWRYGLPVALQLTADGQVIEGRGIAPDVMVVFDHRRVSRGDDPVLREGLRLARGD